MSEDRNTTGCLGVNNTRDLQPIKTPQGDEYIVKLGIFGTKNIAGEHVHPVSAEVMETFNHRRVNYVQLHGAPPEPTVDPRLICAVLSEVKAVPFGTKQILTGKVRPAGPMKGVLLEQFQRDNGQLKLGFQGLVRKSKRNGIVEVSIDTLYGFNLVA